MDRCSDSVAEIEEKIIDLRARISETAERAGREVDEVRLVAISKGQPIWKIRAAYELGLRDFGENRVEEAHSKVFQLDDLEDIKWHMVGHIQSRKAKDVVHDFRYIHSVDRLKLARRLDRFAKDRNVKLPVLLECNVSGESSKYGWDLQEQGAWPSVLEEFEHIRSLDHLDVQGLMTMAPWVDDETILRTCFRRLRSLRDFLASSLPGNWAELSMGMTDDFEYAIEEGSTMVRIGRAIFGAREPK